MRAALIALLVLGLAPAPASAVTVDQIVALSRAGVAESVLLALIDRDKSVFAIEPSELVALKDAGVSAAVILAMLKSGRERPPEAVAAPVQIVGPEIAIVGHGPDRPNTSRREAYVLVAANPIFIPYMLIVPDLIVPDLISDPRTECIARSLPSADPALVVPPAIGRRMNNPLARVPVDCRLMPKVRQRSRR